MNIIYLEVVHKKPYITQILMVAAGIYLIEKCIKANDSKNTKQKSSKLYLMKKFLGIRKELHDTEEG